MKKRNKYILKNRKIKKKLKNRKKFTIKNIKERC